MKLELHHLAPYIPYGITGRYLLSDVIGLAEGHKDELRYEKLTEDSLKFFRMYCKPVLRPLSDLTKEIEHNGEKFVPVIELKKFPFWYEEDMTWFKPKELSCADTVNYPYGVAQKLFEWKFDLFSLIDNGLAIDKNTLTP